MASIAKMRLGVLYQCRLVWENRCKSLKLKPGSKGRARELEAYLQGMLAAMTSANLMSHDEAHRVSFLVACGRAEEWIAAHTDDGSGT